MKDIFDDEDFDLDTGPALEEDTKNVKIATRTCVGYLCGIVFTQILLKQGGGKLSNWCSTKCYHRHLYLSQKEDREKHQEKIPAVYSTCKLEICKKQFVSNKRSWPIKKFCSKKCQQEWHNDHKERKEPKIVGKIEKICPFEQCAKTFTVSERNQKYCSRKCCTKDYYTKNRAKIREDAENSRTKRKYGVSYSEAELLRKTNNGCEICKTTKSSGRFGKLHIDHKKGTSTVRGVLCNRCNMGLGLFNEDPKLLRAAAKYIDKKIRD